MFRVSDIDGSISALCLAHEDLVGSVLTRHRTFAKYLDGMPEANAAEEFPLERWIVERKSDELPGEYVEFELSSPLDFQGVMLPAQQIIANQCPFQYRGPGCNYVGPPVADEFDQPTSDPALDRCGRRPGSCKLRQWPDGVRNYGSYPGAGLIR
jgi:lambda family phage minor tail protein L